MLHGASGSTAAGGFPVSKGDDQMFAACGDGVLIVTKNDSRVVYANPAAEQMFAHHGSSLMGSEFGRPVDGSELDVVGDSHGRVAEMRVTDIALDGHDAWLIMLRDVSARVHALDTARNDRDQARSAAEDKAILLREVDHRVRNTFQMLSALIYLRGRAASSDETKEQMTQLGERVEAIGRSLTILNRASTSGTVDLDAFLRDILIDLSGMRPSVVLRFELEPTTLGVERAQYVGLVVHELVLNAIKYAYPDHAPGEIVVTGNSDGGFITIEVIDAGVGIPDGQKGAAKGLGAGLNQMLTRMLSGTLSIDSGPEGTRCSLRLPAASSTRNTSATRAAR